MLNVTVVFYSLESDLCDSHCKTKISGPHGSPLYKLSVGMLCLPTLCCKMDEPITRFGSWVSDFQFFVHSHGFYELNFK